MQVASVVTETIQLIHWRQQGWQIRKSRRALSRSVCGMLVHPRLGHITHNAHTAIAHAPSGRVVGVFDSTEEARHMLSTRRP